MYKFLQINPLNLWNLCLIIYKVASIITPNPSNKYPSVTVYTYVQTVA
ncbi:hypothetical protein FLJC2902T_03910 [Flavobacterium limnosediminis JC2902]|uniref:Uncharacterized protein n=1 Tax=Flavobacterium limnosediminis JC2902 TaxID=1341181 RepID=V6STE2_9FLAO|nr:hypothetical protein FLJC2902T_03910 [Flavobacterium limnosediminis JC2902]